MNQNRLLELDALRGIAALAVVLFHYFFRYNTIYGHENLPSDWAYYGQLGVELFFMVSGFVIFWTLNRIENPFDFLVSRFSRLYPAYWCAVILTFSSVYIFSLPGREVSIEDAFLNLLMFQEYLKISPVDGVYWTLTVELTFYFWIFLLYITIGFKHIEKIFSLWILLAVLHSLDVFEIPSPIYKIFILKYLPFFLAGICFYKLINEKRTYLLYFYLLFSLFSTLAIYSFRYFLIFTFFYLAFYFALIGYVKFLSIRPFIFLGSISYSLYLIHQNIGYIIINKFYELNLNPLLGISIAIVVSLILATLLSRLVEIPTMKFIREKYKINKKGQKLSKLFTFLKRS